ncbi:hypothetical protein PGT21_029344 [Puccinia graminis f. sp. tritici]|uniref:Uncharacterized protein n=1 Tax=Puccinia graminis f. sp. tritici TaxID=56615 RepID=A0A5B0P991_PUCGR|nr:hypothetical protein PGT21_029344 [Puccinia graminis f. sp. tritici]
MCAPVLLLLSSTVTQSCHQLEDIWTESSDPLMVGGWLEHQNIRSFMSVATISGPFVLLDFSLEGSSNKPIRSYHSSKSLASPSGNSEQALFDWSQNERKSLRGLVFFTGRKPSLTQASGVRARRAAPQGLWPPCGRRNATVARPLACQRRPQQGIGTCVKFGRKPLWQTWYLQSTGTGTVRVSRLETK